MGEGEKDKWNGMENGVLETCVGGSMYRIGYNY